MKSVSGSPGTIDGAPLGPKIEVGFRAESYLRDQLVTHAIEGMIPTIHASRRQSDQPWIVFLTYTSRDWGEQRGYRAANLMGRPMLVEGALLDAFEGTTLICDVEGRSLVIKACNPGAAHLPRWLRRVALLMWDRLPGTTFGPRVIGRGPSGSRAAKVRPLTRARYRKLIADLPRPTEAQRERFALHVSDAHSWYKHLPSFPPGVRFYFLISPSAGCLIKHRSDGRSVPVEATHQEGDPHYPYRSTDQYRREFGYLEYGVKEAPVLYGTRHRFQLPADLLEAGTVPLTGLVHPLAPRILGPPGSDDHLRGLAAGPGKSINPQLAAFYQDVARQTRRLRGLDHWEENLQAVIRLHPSLQGIPPEAIAFKEICRLERERQVRSITTTIDRFCREV